MRLDDCSDRLASAAIARGMAVRRRERGLETDLLEQMGPVMRSATRALSGGAKARASVLAHIMPSMIEAGETVAEEMVGCAVLEERHIRSTINGVSGRDWAEVPIDLLSPVATLETYETLTVRQWARRVGVRAEREVGDVFRRVNAGEIKGAESREALSKALGKMRNGLGFLAATFCYRATAYAREISFQINRGEARGVVWISVLDERTTPHICIPRAWKRYRLPGFTPIGHKLPYLEGPGKIHPRCRARASIVLRGCLWPKPVNGEQWLREQGKELQEDVLGVGRAKLWRSKKYTLGQMVEGDSSELRSLAELEASDLRRIGLA